MMLRRRKCLLFCLLTSGTDLVSDSLLSSTATTSQWTLKVSLRSEAKKLIEACQECETNVTLSGSDATTASVVFWNQQVHFRTPLNLLSPGSYILIEQGRRNSDSAAYVVENYYYLPLVLETLTSQLLELRAVELDKWTEKTSGSVAILASELVVVE